MVVTLIIDDYINLRIGTITKGNKINAINIRHVLYASNLEVQLLANSLIYY